MRKIVIITFIFVLVGLGVYFFKGPRSFSFEKLGLVFNYSQKYFITEKDLSAGERSRYAVILAEDTPQNRDLLAGKIPGTEGPPTITISVFQNNLDKYTARQFVEGTSFSNFKLSDGKITETTIAGEMALRYDATGLYENKNVVVARPDFVYMFTVFFNTPMDPIVSDFEEILKTARFIPIGSVNESLETFTDKQEGVSFGYQENQAASALSQIEQQLTNALKSGGITSENYKAIDEQLKGLENGGVDTSAARAMLAKLDVGGTKKEPVKINKNITPVSSEQSFSSVMDREQVQTPSTQPAGCVSNSSPIFSNYFIDPDLVTNILPPPNRPKSDLNVLKTHSYISTPSMDTPVYAPVDMELIKGAYYVGGPYSLDFKVSCEVMIRLAHIANPTPKIKEAFPAEPQTGSTDVLVNPPLAVKAGELIGYSGGPPYTLAIGFDFGVYNSSTSNRFAAEPEKYNSAIYTTAVCPFDYFVANIKEEYKKKFYLQTHEGMQYDLPHFCQ